VGLVNGGEELRGGVEGEGEVGGGGQFRPGVMQCIMSPPLSISLSAPLHN
jgi:hypothetical protein